MCRIVVLITAVVVAAAAVAAFSDDSYSRPEIFIINPDRTPQHFWTRRMTGEKKQKFNDPLLDVVPASRGYRQAYEGSLVLLKYPPQRVAGPTNRQLPCTHLKAKDEAMSKNFGGYNTRRFASEMSPAEEEYEAVRRALARDRVRPMRRSMVPSMRSESKARRKLRDETFGELLPLTIKLAGLIDKLDSLNVGVKNYREDGAGSTKHRVRTILKDVIDGMEKEVEMSLEKRVKVKSREYIGRENVDERKNHSAIGTKNASSSLHTKRLDEVEEPLRNSKRNLQNQSKRVLELVKATPSSTTEVLTVENSAVSANTSSNRGKSEVRTELDDSEVTAWRLIDSMEVVGRNVSAAIGSPFETSSGSVQEHKAFESAAAKGQRSTEDAETSIELVNRAFDGVPI